MQFLEEKILPPMPFGEEAGSKAREIFEGYDFGELEVLGFDGADSVTQTDGSYAEASIRFYVSPEGEGDSVPMIFRVAFLKKSTVVTVYG